MLFGSVFGGYLLGSIPVAWILTKLVAGRDLRALGSGNVGVLNTALSVHRWTAALVFCAEIFKGAFAVLVPRYLGANEFVIGLTVIATIVGTRWSVWLKFRGGRGNTAAAAALAVYSPLSLLTMVVIYFGARFLLRSNFLAMRVALLTWPFVFGFITQSWFSVLFGAVFSLLFLSTHHPETDDHLLLKQKFPTLWAFLTAPRRDR
ncbi:MAG: glycerol-3-phosphate acyltransferase [Chloroflexi bacterium]|nr:glycerol-3-phosphate acyltransferase [Chloroflexota bacterium]